MRWILDTGFIPFCVAMAFIGVMICLPFVLFARRFGNFFIVSVFFVFVVIMLEVGYANVFSYYFGEIIKMNNHVFLRFAFGGFCLIIGFIFDFILIVWMGLNDEPQGNPREAFLDMLERIHEEDDERDRKRGIIRARRPSTRD